ncbi:hypothetical protein KOW79_020043 [Hemibagrus wyckioides]|uniref:Uncharacterized protein n=1 Tax=Hemibagrus wyckioides TaxID=337641 RepID=A0A9D3N8U3_9TELE|nr:hypothetical protein KOW79_020043 [Hemibagrus wyckioides]
MEGRELEAECTRQEGESVSATEASRSDATLQQQQRQQQRHRGCDSSCKSWSEISPTLYFLCIPNREEETDLRSEAGGKTAAIEATGTKKQSGWKQLRKNATFRSSLAKRGALISHANERASISTDRWPAGALLMEERRGEQKRREGAFLTRAC